MQPAADTRPGGYPPSGIARFTSAAWIWSSESAAPPTASAELVATKPRALRLRARLGREHRNRYVLGPWGGL